MTFSRYKRKKRAKAESEKLKQELEELQKSRQEESAELNQMIQKLSLTAREYQQLKTTFISNISHEMRTPLNAILGFSELSQLHDVTLEEMREYMKIIKKSSEQLLDTIKDVIYIASIDAGEIDLETDNISLKGLFQDLEEYYTFFNSNTADTDAELKFYPPSTDDVYFRSDFSKMLQILKKIIDNALKFTNEGHIEVGYIFSDHTEGKLGFYIKDTGIGIPKDKITLIFEPFRTVDESHSRQFSGSGLGLAIVQRLVRLLKGKIKVDSELGKGTTVKIYIDYRPVDLSASPQNI
ncbi:MAG: sensor histidine kinase [Bacteroidales bacterium]